MAIFCCGFECGVSGGTSHVLQALGSVPAFDTTVFRTGLRSAKYTVSAGSSAAFYMDVGISAGNTRVGRIYVRFAVLPDVNAYIVGITGGGQSGGICFRVSDSKLYCAAGSVGSPTFGATGVSVTTGVWYSLDIKVISSGNPWTFDGRVDGVDLGQATLAVAAGNNNLIAGFQVSTTGTATINFDDSIVSITAGDYPLGAGFVESYAPTRDMVHNVSGSNFLRGDTGTPAGVSITPQASDLWSRIDDLASDDGTFINQAVAASTEYTEHGFKASEQLSGPRAVEVLVAHHEAGTGNCVREWKLNDNGTESAIYQSGSAAGSTSLVYNTKQFATMPNGGAAWTIARFNDVRIRFGYSSDATPDVYFDGALIEAEYSGTQFVPTRISPVFCCGFECGVSGSGTHVTQYITALPSFITTASKVRSGSRSIQYTISGSNGACNLGAVTNQLNIGRIYVMFDVLPSNDAYIFFGTDSQQAGICFKASDSKLYCASGLTPDFGASGVSVTTGVWYRLDLRLDSRANPWLIDAQVDGVSLGQNSKSAAAVAQGLVAGAISAVGGTITATLEFDDFIQSLTLVDYPIGSGHVNAYVCTSDGTHTSTGTNIVKGTTGTPVGTAITAATTDANDWVDATGPIGGGAADNTRLINQQTVAAGEYVELVLADTVELVPPRGVEVLIIDRQAATTAGSIVAKIRENGAAVNLDLLLREATAGVASDRYTTNHYKNLIGERGPWTIAAFNDLRFRFGYSNDATPDQYLRGIMVEAEFPDILTEYGIGGVPYGVVGQQQMRQLLAT